MDIGAFVDYYKILHSAREASDEELKRSYQRLALLLHPDKVGFGHEEEFHILQKAWSILKDPVSRKQYDAELACYENNQLLLYDTITLSEMVYDSSEDVYSYQCRCSGVYYLEANEIYNDDVNIGCNECSFSIQVKISSTIPSFDAMINGARTQKLLVYNKNEVGVKLFCFINAAWCHAT